MSYLPDTVTTEIAFATDPLASPTWTDVSDYVRGFSVKRGRQHELDRFEVGAATVLLDNTDRRFEPEYASGAYYPNVVPMKRLRVRATYDATTYDVFEGFIERWPLEYPGSGTDAVVEVTAVDALVWLSRLKFPAYPALVVGDGADAYYRLGDGSSAWADATGTYADGTTSGTVTSSTSGLLPGETDDGAASFGGGGTDYINLPTGLGFTGTSDFCVEFMLQSTNTGSGVIEAVFSNATDSAADGFNVGVSGDGTEGQIRWESEVAGSVLEGSVNVADGTTHHVVVQRTGGTLYIYVDGALDNSAANTDDLGSAVHWCRLGTESIAGWDPFTGTADEFATYTSALTATQIASHAKASGTGPEAAETSGARIGAVLDEIGWPAGERDIDTGARTVQAFVLNSQDPRDHISEVANTERGLFYVGANGDMTFIDSSSLSATASSATWDGSAATWDGSAVTWPETWGDDSSSGELPYADIVMSYDVDRLRNDVRVSVRGGGTQVATDTTSIDDYGRRTYTLDTHHNTPADALTDAQGIVADYKTPQVRVESIVVNPARGDRWAEVLGVELGDIITVKRRPPGGGSAISQEVRVGAIAHDANPQAGWRTTWQLEPT